MTWLGVDQPTIDSFIQRYGMYRLIAEGVPAGQATLALVDNDCRGTS